MIPGPGIETSTAWITYNQFKVITEQPYLWVNNRGERFFDEGMVNIHISACRCILNQPDRVSYLIFDDDTRKHLEEEGVDHFYFVFPADKLTDVQGQFKDLIENWKNQHVWMEDTLEAICEKAGIDEAGLKKTLEAYNGYCENGEDSQFYKDPKYLRPVRKGPFYAMRVYCGGYNTMGGIKINGKMQVIKENFEPIPGLYAAGDNVLSEFYGNPMISGMPGAYYAMPLGFAAGDSASEYIDEMN